MRGEEIILSFKSRQHTNIINSIFIPLFVASTNQDEDDEKKFCLA